MEGEVVIGNRALEEFRKRLERWDELCAQLRELYYRYLDLAAFRSEKCYFPGRRCKRSWKRQYDMGDLTLMWTYITNTAPLCGKLMRALAEVEYQIRKRALESLEKYGGIEEKKKPTDSHEVVNIRLKRPIHGYLVLWNDKLYVVWEEKDIQSEIAEIEHLVLDIIERYKRGEKVDVQVGEYEGDREYERLWLEIPLLEGASELLSGRAKAPVALFKNLGWLLSDDDRSRPLHGSGNLGQIAVRLFDWIALAKYASGVSSNYPLVFKLSIYRMAKTKNGINPHLIVRPVGTAADVIRSIYKYFGIKLSKAKKATIHGYAVLIVLRERAFKRNGRVYVVDHVGAWIAFSNAVATLILGDGIVLPYEVEVVAKSAPINTPKGKLSLLKELGKALGGRTTKSRVKLRSWQMRLLLPIQPVPIFAKSVKLYNVSANYPAATVVKINNVAYLFTYSNNGEFVIGKKEVDGLREILKRLGLSVAVRKDVLAIKYTQLKKLAKFAQVRLLNELERELARWVEPLMSSDEEVLRSVLEEVAKMAKIVIGLHRGREYVRIIPHDNSKLEEIIAKLKAVGIKFSVNRKKRWIYVESKRSVEVIRKVIPHIFSYNGKDFNFGLYARTTPAFTPFPLHFLCQTGADAVVRRNPYVQNGGHLALDKVELAVKTYLNPKCHTLQSFHSLDISPEHN